MNASSLLKGDNQSEKYYLGALNAASLLQGDNQSEKYHLGATGGSMKDAKISGAVVATNWCRKNSPGLW